MTGRLRASSGARQRAPQSLSSDVYAFASRSIWNSQRDERMNETTNEKKGLDRRSLLKMGIAGTAAIAAGSAMGSIIVPELRRKGLYSANGVFDATSIALADNIYDERFPTSPLILNPFADELVIPSALAPVSASEMDN